MATRTTAHVQAHTRSVETRFEDVLAFLQDQIGPNLTAYIAGRDTSTVSRWIKGDQKPPKEDIERRMRATYRIFQILAETDSNHVVRAWLIGMNPQLDEETPADALREDKLRDVLAAAMAFRAGG
ncbi:hypothetical protein QLG13_08130 [Rhodococcus aetherivorans]|uniref:hypothetical protein n=1 Tax=Rhodococcus aetherivorans TaxID=191292 RepID=UPI003EB79A0A